MFNSFMCSAAQLLLRGTVANPFLYDLPTAPRELQIEI